jgi:hypothetical protein
MMASFAPLGMLETTLAERITFTGWRLRRVARYECEHVRSEQDAAKDEVGEDWLHDQHQYGRDDGAEAVEDVLRYSKWWEQFWPSVNLLAEGSDEIEMNRQGVVDLLYRFLAKLKVSDPAGNANQQLKDQERWTVGLLRQRLRLLVEKHGKGRASLDSVLEAIKEDGVQARRDTDQVKQRLNDYRREHLLPDERTLEKVMRYETHLSRLLHRDLRELQRLQEMRQGRFAPAPVAIDIDGASSPKTGSENGV